MKRCSLDPHTKDWSILKVYTCEDYMCSKSKDLSFYEVGFFFLHIIIGPYRLICHPIYNCFTLWRGPWCFVHPLEGVQNTMDPSHSVQQLFCYTLVTLLFIFSKFCCHPRTILHSLKICFTVPSNLRLFRTKCGNRPMVGTIRVMYTGEHHSAMVHVYLLHGGTWLILDQSNFTVCYRGITMCFEKSCHFFDILELC